MIIFSMCAKKRIPTFGMSFIEILQDSRNKTIEKYDSMSRINTPNIIINSLIVSNVMNECKIKEKDIIIYNIGCEGIEV